MPSDIAIWFCEFQAKFVLFPRNFFAISHLWGKIVAIAICNFGALSSSQGSQKRPETIDLEGHWGFCKLRRTQEDCGGLWRESPGAFPNSAPIFPRRFLPFSQKRAEYSLGEYNFKRRTQWVFRPALSSGERTQRVPLSLVLVCQSELTKFVAELSEVAAERSEFSLAKQYSRNSILPISHSPHQTLAGT